MNTSPSDDGLSRAIKIAGGLSALASLLGYSPQRVKNWQSRSVPESQCPFVEQVTGVKSEELRPDLADKFAILRRAIKRRPAKEPAHA
jgi:DNA-binding transcriptional regulator YdaS (Cro superfamily)